MHYHQKEIIENSSSSSREFLNFVLNAFCPSSTTARSRHSFQPCFSIDHFEKCIIHTIVGKSLKNVSFDNFAFLALLDKSSNETFVDDFQTLWGYSIFFYQWEMSCEFHVSFGCGAPSCSCHYNGCFLRESSVVSLLVCYLKWLHSANGYRRSTQCHSYLQTPSSFPRGKKYTRELKGKKANLPMGHCFLRLHSVLFSRLSRASLGPWRSIFCTGLDVSICLRFAKK